MTMSTDERNRNVNNGCVWILLLAAQTGAGSKAQIEGEDHSSATGAEYWAWKAVT